MVRDMETIGDNWRHAAYHPLIPPPWESLCRSAECGQLFQCPPAACSICDVVKKCQKYHIPKRSEKSILRWPFEVRAYVKFRSVVTAWQVESLQSNTQRPDSADQALRLRASFAQICIVVALGQAGMLQIHVMTQGVQFPVAVQPFSKSSSTSLHKSFCILH